MKFCDRHWSTLRDAIDERSLGHLVSKSQEDARQRVQSQVDNGGVVTLANFCPLMGAHNAITAHTLQHARELGTNAVLELMAPAPDNGGEWCPLCFLNALHWKGCKDLACRLTYDKWIDGAADDQLLVWDSLNPEVTLKTD